MSEKRASYQVLGWQNEALHIQVAQPLEARELLEDLLCSKVTARRVLARQQLCRDGLPLAPTSQLLPGDKLVLNLHRPTVMPAHCAEPVEVLYQDEILLAANKPAGILVHSDGSAADTLTARVHNHLARQGRTAHVQAVQRLDVETSGLVLFSLTEEFQPALDAQVAGHDMHKRYLAVIKGKLAGSQCDWLDLTGPIARDRHDARKMRVGASGKPSLTKAHTLQQQGGYSLLLIELGTGRKHQIRVHLAHAGHPILGDTLYGGSSYPNGLMLHAYRESLVHPITGEHLTFQTPWPTRFSTFFSELAVSSV